MIELFIALGAGLISFLCCLRLLAVVNLLGHSLQPYGLSPVCILSCLFKLEICQNYNYN